MKKVLIFIWLVLMTISLGSCSFEATGGSNGKSAYDIAVEHGFTGTEEEWLESLKGKDGESLHIVDIYSMWLKEGNTGTFDEFITKYFAETYIVAKSAYDLAKEAGFEGTEEEWLASLKGDMGMTGPAGESIDLYQVYYELRYELQYIDCTYLEFIETYLKVDVNPSNTEVIAKTLRSAVSIAASNYTAFDSSGNVNPNFKYAAGAGVIYQLNGEGDAYIITNYHVVFDDTTSTTFKNIFINLYGNQSLYDAIPAKLIGGSATYDIAVLYVDGATGVLSSKFSPTSSLAKPGYQAKDVFAENEATPITTANSDYLAPGTTAIAIGNPQGDGIAATEGIVSVDSESIYMTPVTTENVNLNEKGLISMRVLRIDTAVNPGNSGGGLFNDKGQLIGIVNAKTVSEEIDNVSYAIPSNVAIYVANNIIRNKGSIIKPLIGISVYVESSYAQYDPTTASTRIYETVVVGSVDSNSVVFEKVQAGDVIKSVTIDGVTYEATRNFIVLDACLNANVGSSAEITVIRGSKEYTYSFTFNNYTLVG